MARYRRVPLSRQDSIASLTTSLVVGAGAVVVTYYVTRLFLSREPLPRSGPALPKSPTPEALPAPVRADAAED